MDKPRRQSWWIEWANRMFWIVLSLIVLLVASTVLFFAGERDLAFILSNLGTALVFGACALLIVLGKEDWAGSDKLVGFIGRHIRRSGSDSAESR